MVTLSILKMEISMENICRTCMNEESDMISLFNTVIEDITDKTVADILMNCTSVQVNAEDGLPSLICQHCVKLLTTTFKFKYQSEEIDATLREITKNPNIEFIKVEDYNSDSTELITYESDHEINLCSIQTDKILVSMENIESKGDITIEENIQEIEYVCERCFKSFKEYEDYEQHQNLCCVNSFTCEKCDTTFKSKNKYTMHKYVYCTKSYECKECNILFEAKDEYAKHRKTHTKLFKCKVCEKIFRSSHGLSYHMKIHNGIKNFLCPHENCQKKFAIKQALEKHVSTHSKDGNHLCYLCGKMYSTSDSLYYHIKTHEGRRPHLCVHCGKTFKQMCHLKSHMWIHNGIKPHECETCGKCYTSGHQLKKHLRKYCNNFSIKTN